MNKIFIKELKSYINEETRKINLLKLNFFVAQLPKNDEKFLVYKIIIHLFKTNNNQKSSQCRIRKQFVE